uniref:Uncharacterized protein n=1 Tax=Romanomermis culicivorax TaxID=13658 RepID=A0A915L9T0_ROMCU
MVQLVQKFDQLQQKVDGKQMENWSDVAKPGTSQGGRSHNRFQKQDDDAQQQATKDIPDTGPAPNKLQRGHDLKCCGIYEEYHPSVSAKDLPLKGFVAS